MLGKTGGQPLSLTLILAGLIFVGICNSPLHIQKTTAYKAPQRALETQPEPTTTPEPSMAPTPSPQPTAQITVLRPAPAPTPQANSQIDAKMFIYQHESGNDPTRVNGIGACGLGQALPCSKMHCALNDYGCQDEFFTNYMRTRYGTWENAKAFWLARTPINGQDVGHWW